MYQVLLKAIFWGISHSLWSHAVWKLKVRWLYYICLFHCVVSVLFCNWKRCLEICQKDERFFHGTLFRLATRNKRTAKLSGISNREVLVTDIEKLVKDLWKSAQELLLFTRNVKVLRVYTTLGQERRRKAALVMETEVSGWIRRYHGYKYYKLTVVSLGALEWGLIMIIFNEGNTPINRYKSWCVWSAGVVWTYQFSGAKLGCIVSLWHWGGKELHPYSIFDNSQCKLCPHQPLFRHSGYRRAMVIC